jgi:hypothetical protein
VGESVKKFRVSGRAKAALREVKELSPTDSSVDINIPVLALCGNDHITEVITGDSNANEVNISVDSSAFHSQDEFELIGEHNVLHSISLPISYWGRKLHITGKLAGYCPSGTTPDDGLCCEVRYHKKGEPPTWMRVVYNQVLDGDETMAHTSSISDIVDPFDPVLGLRNNVTNTTHYHGGVVTGIRFMAHKREWSVTTNSPLVFSANVMLKSSNPHLGALMPFTMLTGASAGLPLRVVIDQAVSYVAQKDQNEFSNTALHDLVMSNDLLKAQSTLMHMALMQNEKFSHIAAPDEAQASFKSFFRTVRRTIRAVRPLATTIANTIAPQYAPQINAVSGVLAHAAPATNLGRRPRA